MESMYVNVHAVACLHTDALDHYVLLSSVVFDMGYSVETIDVSASNRSFQHHKTLFHTISVCLGRELCVAVNLKWKVDN